MNTADVTGLTDATPLGRLANEAGCLATCHWRADYIPHRGGWQIRHNGGEAILVEDYASNGTNHPIDAPGVRAWLKTLHPAE